MYVCMYVYIYITILLNICYIYRYRYSLYNSVYDLSTYLNLCKYSYFILNFCGLRENQVKKHLNSTSDFV